MKLQYNTKGLFHFSTLLLALVSLIIFMVSCKSGPVYGKPIDKKIPHVSLQTILQDPSAFVEKEVVLKGILTAQCGNLCEFTLRDGNSAVKIFPSGFKVPRFKQGQPLEVLAMVHVGAQSTVFSAFGVAEAKGGRQ